MARKVFISILGTGFYGSCKYAHNEFTANESRFVQTATLEWIGAKQWSAADSVLVFVTEKAKKENWDKSIEKRKNFKTEKEEDYFGLEKCLLDMELPLEVKPIDIKDGKDEAEMWKIFDAIYSQLQPKDELYIDLTHSFRYLPMLLLVLSNYAKFLKDISIVHISYGNYEAIDKTTNIAPFVDLLPLVTLQKITSVTSAFTQFGKISEIATMFPEETSIKNTLNQIKKALDNLEDCILANRMEDIRKGLYIREIKNNLKSIYKSDIPDAEQIVLKRMEEEIKEFVAEDSDKNILAAINWAFKYGMLVQAYTLAQEYIITLVCNLLIDKNPYLNSNLKVSERTKKFRMFINSILAINPKDTRDRSYKGALNEYETLTNRILEIDWVIALKGADYFKLLADNRNILNHAKGTTSADDLRNQFKPCFDNCISLLDNHFNQNNQTNQSSDN